MPLTSAVPMLGMLGLAIAAYAVLLRILAAITGARGGRLLHESWRPTVVAISLFALGILLFAAIAAPLRQDPPGAGAYRQGADRDVFLAAARYALAAIYAAAVLVAFGLGAWLGPQGDRARIGVMTILGLLGFMVLAAPLTELMAECYANVTMFLRPSC